MYSLVTTILAPFPVLFLALGLALVQIWRKPCPARRPLVLATIPYLALFLWCWPPTAHLALGSLEWSYPPQTSRPPEAVIVVLAGWLQTPDAVLPEAVLGDDTLRRCSQAVRLYRRTGPCPILVSGGRVDPETPGPTLAGAMKQFLMEHGIPEENIWLEERSRSTFENALYSAELLRSRDRTAIALVTDAAHLRRAARCFRAQGLEVTPSGAQYRATEFVPGWRNFLPSPAAAANNQDVLHEWLGLAWYWMKGRL